MEGKLIDITERKLCTERFLASLMHSILRYFGLHSCLVCNAPSNTICDHCSNYVQYIPTSCWFCQQYSKAGLSHTKCRDSRGWYDRKLYLYAYTKVIKRLYRLYKFKKVFLLQHIVYKFVKDYIKKDPFLVFEKIFNPDLKRLHLFVPVPMSKKKKIERGFSPTEEFALMLGRELSKKKDLQVAFFPTLFKKQKETLSQAKKDRIKRLISIQHAFDVDITSLNTLKELINSHKLVSLWIIDDVHTTGATATILIELLTNSLGLKMRNKIEINFLSFAKA